jgi:hypothetical protein
LIKLGVIVPGPTPHEAKSTQVGKKRLTKSLKKKASNTTAEGRAGALDRWKQELEHKENPNKPKNLDHTRPYAHAYRETGRFGSHPSHDGFDDESNS